MDVLPASKKPRRPNFTPLEALILVEEVTKRCHILVEATLGPNLTRAHMNEAWNQVARAVNQVSFIYNKF